MHSVTVACQGCGREYAYQTMFMSAVGVAVCPHCGLCEGAAPTPDLPLPPRDVEGRETSSLSESKRPAADGAE